MAVAVDDVDALLGLAGRLLRKSLRKREGEVEKT